MSKFKNEFKSFMEDMEKNIKNHIYILGIGEEKEEKISLLEEEQKQINEKMQKMQQVLDNIEQDIYSDEGFDFEIVCPYCDYEFVIDVDDNKTEIKCPKCDNIIELNWSGNLEDDIDQGGCQGHCLGCHGCDDVEQDADDDDM